MTGAGGFEVAAEGLGVGDGLVENQGIDRRQTPATHRHEGEQEDGNCPADQVQCHA
jgi:hypothetical protein